jgi:exodeoxyribonuclease VII large subunit
MQGTEAIPQLVRCFRQIRDTPNARERYGDVIVVARGGGSIEDLWCFNDEAVVRAMAELPIPVATGIGHEIDFTIADFVSDFRAPTPSAAAEVLSQGWSEVRALLLQKKARLMQAMQNQVERKRRKLQVLEARLKNPRDVLREKAQRVDDAQLRLFQAVRGLQRSRRQAFLSAASKLDALSPLKVLARGYSVVYRADESNAQSNRLRRVVTDARTLALNDAIEVQFREGRVSAIVSGVEH